jgi:hypothetical protein
MQRQALARWGVLSGYRLLKQYSAGYEAMHRALIQLPPGEKLDLAPIYAALELEHRKISAAKAIVGTSSS